MEWEKISKNHIFDTENIQGTHGYNQKIKK